MKQPIAAESEHQRNSTQYKSTDTSRSQTFVDNRESTQHMRQLKAAMKNSPQAIAQRKLSEQIRNSPRMLAQRQQFGKITGAALQRVASEEEPLQGKFVFESTAQREQQSVDKPNNTGLPDNLKSGIESLSGMSMDSVRVHYNSSQPAQLNALAYAQGTDIHVAPGQEQHLPHEAWHVVQQAQGRVKPTMQLKDGVLNSRPDPIVSADPIVSDPIVSRCNSTHLSTIQGYWIKREVPKNESNVAGLEAFWVSEATRKRPPYQPYGAKLLLTLDSLGGWSHFPNFNEGKLTAHAPHHDDEKQKRFGYSMELKQENSYYNNINDQNQLPPVNSTVVFKRGGAAKVSSHGFSFLEDKGAKAILTSSEGFPEKGVTAGPREWFYETPLESNEVTVSKVSPELNHTLFGFSKIYFNREQGTYDISQEENSKEIDALTEMESALGAKPYYKWGNYSLEKPDTLLGKGTKMALIGKAMHYSGSIAFNLDALTSNSARNISQELRSVNEDEARMGTFTIAELKYILTHADILGKTKFYKQGQLISHEGAEDILGVKFTDSLHKTEEHKG